MTAALKKALARDRRRASPALYAIVALERGVVGPESGMEDIAIVDDDHAFSLPSLLDELPRKLPHDFLHHLIRAGAANEIAKKTEAEGEFALPVRIFVFEHLCNELLVPALLI